MRFSPRHPAATGCGGTAIRSGGRLVPLDLLRGAAVAAMIVVNNPGNWNRVFPPLTHAPWHGVTLADLIFPMFIFVMGAALSLSLSTTPRPAASTYGRIARRGLLIVAIGFALNLAAPSHGVVRIPGVLQRIGITYVLTAVIVLNTTPAGCRLAAVLLLLAHWGVLAWGGTLDPGRNIAATIDRLIFGRHTLLAGGDPEGLLGVLSSVATALFGAEAGRLLRVHAVPAATSVAASAASPGGRLVAAGAGAVVVALLWSRLLPFNKSLWTPSFALLAAGVATVCLAACLSDAPTRSRAAAPLLWLGVNPLVIYVLSELGTVIMQRPLVMTGGVLVAPKELLYWDWLVPVLRDDGGPWSSFVYGLIYAMFWTAVAGAMQMVRGRRAAARQSRDGTA